MRKLLLILPLLLLPGIAHADTLTEEEAETCRAAWATQAAACDAALDVCSQTQNINVCYDQWHACEASIDMPWYCGFWSY